MQDKELYYHLLGLKEPWEVRGVEVDMEGQKVDVYIQWPPEKKSPCPECGKPYPIYDHREERRWRHLDTMQFETLLHCRVPRVKCKEHGVKSADVPWAGKHSRFTAMFERLAIEMLLACQNQTKAMQVLRLSWDETHRIQERAVKRGLKRRSTKAVEYLGVDEKSFLRRHQYATVVSDIKDVRVIDVARDRKEESLSRVFEKMPDEQRAAVKAVAVDMWRPYMNVVQEYLSEADIVHDKFHIAKHLGEAVDKVRRAENKVLVREGVDNLKGTRYLWLTNPVRWTEEQKGLFKELRKMDLKVARAWAIKEMFSRIWEYVYEGAARNFFKKWYWLATHSRLKPVVDTARMIKRHLENILTYLKHGITNAVAEALNSRIQQIKSAAKGFRNFENYRTAILFYCGKLDMYPHKSQ